ncbi:hypothetical protein GCM10017567_51030 [Amycolatopsis bullii]|uniref:Uncharacterized protein n=1 Tax=Amycolatopsis bullii TaxID=941987 RepID=A0ABQ3KM23_9PSEU|nr:hypothetical protein GCM10017567_51030 [Amycolatopsis bullii]
MPHAGQPHGLRSRARSPTAVTGTGSGNGGGTASAGSIRVGVAEPLPDAAEPQLEVGKVKAASLCGQRVVTTLARV